MNDTEPQTAAGKVPWHCLMSPDGVVAGPRHEMDWMTGTSVRPGLHAEHIETTGDVLARRDRFDVGPFGMLGARARAGGTLPFRRTGGAIPPRGRRDDEASDV